MTSTFFAFYKAPENRVRILALGGRDALGHNTLEDAVRANSTRSPNGRDNRCPIVEVVTDDEGVVVDMLFYPGVGNLA